MDRRDVVLDAPPDGRTASDVEPPDDGAALPPPRPLGPLSGAFVPTTRPLLRWELPPGVTEVRLEVSLGPSDDWPLQTFDLTGTQAIPADLDSRTSFHRWRLRARRGRRVGDAGPWWWYQVASTAGPPQVSWGAQPDFIPRNGDGLADLLIPDPVEPGGSRSWSFFGGSAGIYSSGLRPVLAPCDHPREPRRIEVAGDVNGDGLMDLLASCLGATARTGVILGALAYPPDVEAVLPVPHGEAGLDAPRFAGDVDGDGYGDLIAASRTGMLALYRGSPAGIRAVPDQRVALGEVFAGVAEVRVTSAGDVDGDGYWDIVAAAVTPRESGAPTPVVFYRGGAGGLGAAVTTALRLPADEDRYARLHVLAGAGDVNRDGRPDVFLDVQPRDSSQAVSRVFLGGSRGLDAAPVGGARRAPAAGEWIGPLGDLDADGDDDLGVVTPDGQLRLMRGAAAGPGELTAPMQLEVPPGYRIVGVHPVGYVELHAPPRGSVLAVEVLRPPGLDPAPLLQSYWLASFGLQASSHHLRP